MKKLLLIAIVLIVSGCQETVYVDSSGKQILKPVEVSNTWKAKIKTACLDGVEYWVYDPRSQTSTMAVRMVSPTEAKTCD